MRHIRLAVVVVLVLGGLFFAVAGGYAPGAAQAGAASPIRILEQTTVSRFRRDFTFRLRVRSDAGMITYARVIYETRAIDKNTSRTLQFRAANEVELAYRWNTVLDSIPPWQIVYYRWEIGDSAGNTLLTPPTRAEVEDTTRDWQKLTDNKVSVYWYDQPLSFGQELLSIAQQGYTSIARATGYAPDDELRVVMYNDQEVFCSFFAPGVCQEWFAGVTFGSITVQYLIPERERFVMRQVVPHELTHAFLNDWMGLRVTKLPRWFNEGTAMNNELEGMPAEIERAQALGMASKLTRLALMDQAVVQDRSSSIQVANWYTQSGALVAFLLDRWGNASLGEVVGRVRDGMAFEAALKEVTQLTMDEYEVAWREWLGVTSPLPRFFPSPTFMPFPPTPTYEPTPVKRS